jgi:threonine dehydrogenase-like Zn-dependent dehydrogenase
MRAFLVTERGVGTVAEVDPPVCGPDQVVVDVALVGVCGTDVSIFYGDATRIGRNRLEYPIRLGHEWCGTVSEIGSGVDAAWLGKRVTGDTLLGCGHCTRCLAGYHYLCDDRYGIGVRRGWPGALAERLLVPVPSLRALPDAVTDEMGAMVEPGANAFRAVEASGAVAGSRVLIVGPGNIGLLTALFALAAGSEVHVIGETDESLELARAIGVAGAWRQDELPSGLWDAVIDATNSADMPQFALDTVEVARRVVYVGVSIAPSLVDSRRIVHKELQVFGILGGSLGLNQTIEAYASGAVDPRVLLGSTVGLDAVAEVFAGHPPHNRGPGPKVLVNPTA